jgi:hypothetical protein
MKRTSYIPHMMMLGMFVVLTAGIGHAQYEHQIMAVKIPFDFSIGKQSFPAGEYTLKRSLQHTMLLRNQRGQVLTSIATNSVESREAPRSVKVVFNGYSGRYFLGQIWEAGNSNGQQVIKSPVEIEIARHPPGLTAVSFVTH